MGWILAIVALSLVMMVMTIAEFRQPANASAVKLPDLTVVDHVIALFVLGTCTLAIINGLMMVAAETLP